eukprot:3941667-Rhodomonas_salina.1
MNDGPTGPAVTYSSPLSPCALDATPRQSSQRRDAHQHAPAADMSGAPTQCCRAPTTDAPLTPRPRAPT